MLKYINVRRNFFGFAGVSIAICAVFGIATGALADGNKTFPKIEAAIPIEIENDYSYRSDDADNEHSQLFIKAEPEATLRITREFSAYIHTVFTSVRDQDPGESRVFEDNGLFVEDVFLRYETGRFAVQGGKFTPAFGIAWDVAPGIYGSGFAEAGYEFAERIGISAGAGFGDEATGNHTFTAHTFFLDTSVLSESLFQGRGTTDKEDGGLSNTESFKSWALTLDGTDTAGIKGLGYRVSYILQKAGVTEATDETGWSVALMHNMGLGNSVTISPLFEYVHFDDQGGVVDQEVDYLNLAVGIEWKNWNLALAYVDRDTAAADGTETDDYDFQVSVGYSFDFGLNADIGWHITEESNVETRQIGAMLSYTITF